MVKKLHNKFSSIMMRLFSYKEIIIEMPTFLIDEPWIENLDLDTIKEVEKDFISPTELDDFQSDMLWKVNLKNTNCICSSAGFGSFT